MRRGGEFPARLARLEAGDVCCLQALGTFSDLEFDSLPLVERSVPFSLNRGEVDEHVLTGLTLDESETLARVEPLNCSLFFHSNSYFLVLSYLVRLTPREIKEKKGGLQVWTCSPLNESKGFTRATNAVLA